MKLGGTSNGLPFELALPARLGSRLEGTARVNGQVLSSGVEPAPVITTTVSRKNVAPRSHIRSPPSTGLELVTNPSSWTGTKRVRILTLLDYRGRSLALTVTRISLGISFFPFSDIQVTAPSMTDPGWMMGLTPCTALANESDANAIVSFRPHEVVEYRATIMSASPSDPLAETIDGACIGPPCAPSNVYRAPLASGSGPVLSLYTLSGLRGLSRSSSKLLSDVPCEDPEARIVG